MHSLNPDLMILALFCLVLVLIPVYAYVRWRPFGTGTPLRVLARYPLSENGGTFEIIVVGFRKGAICDEETLERERIRARCEYASREDLEILLQKGNFIRGHFIQSRMEDGTACYILAGSPNVADGRMISFCNYDVFALVKETHAVRPKKLRTTPVGAA